jgi:hypothetical protein
MPQSIVTALQASKQRMPTPLNYNYAPLLNYNYAAAVHEYPHCTYYTTT